MKNNIWACVISNIVSLSCCTTLAVVFNKWWIILFAALFFVFPSSKHKYYRICDGCGKHSPYTDSYNEALDKAKENGWTHYVEGNKDYCIECKRGN